LKKHLIMLNISNSIDVTSIDEVIDKVINNGVNTVVPKKVIPQMGYFPYFIDNQDYSLDYQKTILILNK